MKIVLKLVERFNYLTFFKQKLQMQQKLKMNSEFLVFVNKVINNNY